MVIKINIHNEIVWPVVGFWTLKYLGITEQWLFIIAIIWLLYVSVRNNRLVMTIPKVYGFIPYLLFAIVSIIIGIISNELRDVIKDIFYIFPTIIVIMIGYLYNKYDKNEGKSITKTLYLTGFIITILTFINFLTSISSISDLGTMRSILIQQVYETTLVFGIMFSEKIIGKKIIFSKVWDWIIILTLMLKGIISLGRTEMIVTFATILIVLLLNIYFAKNKSKSFINLGIIALLIIMVGVSAYNVLPSNIRTEFSDKLKYSFEEIDSNTTYESTEEAMAHWRAYEVDCAIDQWKETNVFSQVFGLGFGEYIKIKYVPHNFTGNMVKNNAIALLHNSYYSILVKGGLLGVVATLWLFISNLILVFRKKYKEDAFEVSAMCVLIVGMMIYTYVITGIFTQSFTFVWPFMIGWFNGRIRNVEATNLNLEIQPIYKNNKERKNNGQL